MFWIGTESPARESLGKGGSVLGDEERFTEFCRSQHPRLVGLLSHYCGNADLAEDLAQEALARVYRDWRKLQRIESLEAWTYRVAINLANTHHRRRAMESRSTARGEAPAPVLQASEATDKVAVRSAVASLPARQKMALLFRYFADLSVEQTAAAMEVPEGTVKSLVSRALKALNVQITDSEMEEAADVR